MKGLGKIRIIYDSFREAFNKNIYYVSRAEKLLEDAQKDRNAGDMYRGKLYNQQDMNRNTYNAVCTLERVCIEARNSSDNAVLAVETLAKYFLSDSHIERQKNNLIRAMTPDVRY